ncbi:MAG: hypothetical protein WBG86_13545 [Polyangiales bacterium]
MLTTLSTGCGEDGAVEGLTVPLACENDPLRGYVHTFAASRFDAGEPVTYEVDSQSERWIGPRGTFAARRGSSRAISNATSPALERPGLVPVEVHENETVTYFTDRGLDPAQIANVGSNSLISGNEVETEFVALYSSLSRAWNGIPVIDSVADARFNDARQSVSESVFWPEIPCEVLDAAEVIRDDIARPDSFLLARVEEVLGPDFTVIGTAIRHASRDRPDGDPFTARAVLAVGQLQTRYEFDLNGELVATIGPRSGPSE